LLLQFVFVRSGVTVWPDFHRGPSRA
jgi:hypothetical protein